MEGGEMEGWWDRGLVEVGGTRDEEVCGWNEGK